MEKKNLECKIYITAVYKKNDHGVFKMFKTLQCFLIKHEDKQKLFAKVHSSDFSDIKETSWLANCLSKKVAIFDQVF